MDSIEKQWTWEEEIKGKLSFLQQISQIRQLVNVEQAEQTWLKINDRKLLNLASNNYLGLAGDERLKKAAIEAVQKRGCGSTASRLIVGNHPGYQEAESALINWKGLEAGLILGSGYLLNTGIISCIVGRDDIVFSDRLNHASIVDGVRLSRAEHKRYRHNDMNHLESLLKKASGYKRKLIVTDTVFSMDGDIAPLSDLVTLKERYQAILMVDEAHSSGIYGMDGKGYVHHLGLQDQVEVQMGTFSKALGCYGAYVVGSKWFVDYLVNKMRSFIFTTALPSAVLGSIQASIQIVQKEGIRREALLNHAEYFREKLSHLGFNICHSQTQIVPILIGPNDQAMQFSQLLQENGIFAVAIRPPTVPNNQARIRFTIMATHKKHELDWAIEKIAAVGKKLGVIS
ncbi:8-amino-7-oxononanoate synthase [Microaerobacter geothermalis]|uniref:8-amino-7-oxononanoate synthase n=1 Tax=Microaerobacter geothermalis TaxID=674972 RepID=UPI001F24A9C9|nr:8-amino-7-oxononanoate synthase [Microaerobacter geothermalis]MCF6094287.1 8-amino-7-oxononanoate synthase [Microaerobacter geothermalis]